MPSARRLPRYRSWASPGSGLRITWNWVWHWIRFGFSPYRASSGRTDGSTYATRHGSGPNTRKNVAGFNVPAPTSVFIGCIARQPWAVQYAVSWARASCIVSTANAPLRNPPTVTTNPRHRTCHTDHHHVRTPRPRLAGADDGTAQETVEPA